MLILRNTIRIPVKPNLTDRAKRYRAQHPERIPLPPKQCNYCGSKKNVGVHHVTGNEDDGHPDNLQWACKRCNAKIAHLMKQAGVGKRTAQYNPKKRGSSTMGEYAAAIKVMRASLRGTSVRRWRRSGVLRVRFGVRTRPGPGQRDGRSMGLAAGRVIYRFDVETRRYRHDA
jgi:hypothetical protein